MAEAPRGDDVIPATPEVLSATPEGERIAKAIARAGVASRRDVEAMIEAGRVTLNGKILASPAINVTESDRITVDGEPLPVRERTRLWILHKPRGVVTTARDPEGRQTVFDVVPEELPRVVAIGRLDINTEGLLLLTNDGGLAKVIAHPDTGWLRKYRVRAFGEITQVELDKLRKGVTIDGMEYGPVEAHLDRAQGDNIWLTLGLREGKNREVKRILEHLGLSVNRLIRLSFGPFQLGDLEVGLVEEIRTKVLKEQLGKTLSEQAGVDFESPTREPIAPFGKPKKPAAASAERAGSQGQKAPREGGRSREPSYGRPSFDRQGRDPSRPARPAAPARVPTGGMSAGPRESIWRADDNVEKPHGTKIPRRGADPKASRAAAAERGRERVGAIQTAGDRRVLVERLQPSPEVPAPEPHRRTRFRTQEERPQRSGDDRAPRADARPRRQDGDAPPRRENFEDRGERRGPPRDRPQGGERSGGFRGEERPRSFGGGRDRPEGGANRSEERPRSFGGGRDRPEGGAGRSERPGGFRGDRPVGDRGGFKGGEGRPGPGGRSDRPAGGGFRADKPAGGRPGAGRSFKPGGDRPGGFRSDRPGGGDRPGGFRSDRPGGGGFKAGAGRPGGGFKGGKPGGRPGGFGGKPDSRGGGRPPRAGK
ncbi:pseudouridine synthase [Methylobacterium sp. WL9]|uniref:pseudouridine synthase n=1 Tax=Methylobacterium sp. WL9 TaxID=2603898 RepID=UPI0011CB5210|nr:pseudouridine synthase [Methylobacterium sp. WL9]TXN24209.1 pseudouridine synthase [Methylobacterium sp. WL9]